MMASAVFIRRPAATLLIALGLAVFGVVAFIRLPVAAIPQVDYPTIEVDTYFPGASAETMASSVAAPLEKQFGWVDGLDSITSNSSQGATIIELRFNLSRHIDAAALDVQAAINNAAGDLPRDLPAPPFFYKTNPADRPIVVLAFTSDTLPLSTIDRYVDTMVARRLSGLPGVARAFLADEQKFAIRVQADPLALAARGLSLEDLRHAIERTSIDRPKGQFTNPRHAAAIEGNDQLFDTDAYRRVILAWRNDAPVRIGDVARIVGGVENNKTTGWYNGKPAIIVGVQRQAGANTVATVDGVRASLAGLRQTLPPAIRVDVVSDRAETVRASVAEVERTLALTIVLVVAVIFVFLRNFWATVIPSIAIPLSLLATSIVMAAAGYTLDNLSLMALTISVGFIVDDAIVVIENIVRRMEAGEAPVQAAIEGSRQVGFTILSITVSLVAVFIPVFFMGGITGRLFREFAVTVSVATVVSALVSLAITPMMCARLLRPVERRSTSPLAARLGRAMAGLTSGYARSLRWALTHQGAVLLVFLATTGFAGYLYVAIPKGFFPAQDNGRIFAFAETGLDTSFPAMAGVMQRLTDIVRKDPDIFSVATYAGDSGSENTGSLVINLKRRTERRSNVTEVMARLRAATSHLRGVGFYMQPEPEIALADNFGRSEYEYSLVDANRAELDAWAPVILAKLKQMPGLLDVATDQQTGARRVRITIDRDLASRLGVDPQAVDDTLYDAFGARHVAEVYTDASQYYVLLEVDPAYQLGPEALTALYVASTAGAQVPLSTFVHVATETGALSVNHRGQLPSVTLTFNLAPGWSIGQAVDSVGAMVQRLGKPITLQANFTGTAREFETSLASEPWLIASAILVIYIVLGILYESLIHPLTVLSSLPPVGVGACLALMLAGRDLGVIGLIGVLLLIGIVKKNAILMIDFAIQAERVEGKSPADAIYEACRLRFRPILMTTMAALFGSLPLALSGGAGSELRQPLGIAILGGLLISQVLTLYTTPVIHLQLRRLTAWLGGGFTGPSGSRAPLTRHDPSPHPLPASGARASSSTPSPPSGERAG